MFKIILSPISSNKNDTPPDVNGSVFTYRGEDYDLSQLPIGAEVEADLPFIGKVKNNQGVIEVTLQYMYDNTALPNQSTDWNDYTFTIESGTFNCPIARKPVEEDVE